VWSNQLSPKLAIVVYLFKKLKRRHKVEEKGRGRHKKDKGAGVERE
jgi:hypothetical protein